MQGRFDKLIEEAKKNRNSISLMKNKTLFAIIIVLFTSVGILTTYVLNSYLKRVALNNLTQANAEQTSSLIFEIMYTKMQDGWNKEQINHIISRMNSINPGMKVNIYRSPLVEKLYGEMPQDKEKIENDKILQQAMAGNFQFIPNSDDSSARYIYPMKVKQECVSCHTNAKIGDINGVIDITFPSNNIQIPLENIMKYFLIFTIIAMLTTLFIFQKTINRVFISPIANFTDAIDSIVINDKFNEYVHCNPKTHELKVLELSFNHLMEKVNIVLMEIKNRNKLLEEYKRAIDNSTIVTKTDINGIITYVNQHFIDISGYKEEELIGQNHNIVRSPNMPKEAFADLWSTILKKQKWHGIVENVKKNGESYFVSATVMPILDEHNEITEFIAIRQDITELKQLQVEELKTSIIAASTINTKEMVKMFVFPAVSIDQDDHIVAINDSFKRTFEQYAFNTTNLSDLFIGDAGYISKDEIFDWKDIVLDLQNEVTQKVLISVDEIKKEFYIIISKHASDKNYLVFLIPSSFCKVQM